VIVAIDGELVEDPKISILDRGFLFGDGLFETFRTWDGVAVDADEHLARLHASAAALALRVGPIDLAAAIAAAGGGDLRVKVIVTRGPGAPGVPFGTLGAGPTIVIAEPLRTIPETVTAAVVDLPIARRAVVHKTLSYLDSLVAQELARATGADEAIRLDSDGWVCEGAMSNVFIVDDGVAFTPPLGTGALAGITRAQVIALGACEERISVARLRRAEEIFVTSSVRGVVAVTRLDGDARSVGRVTAQIRRAHQDEMRRRAKHFVAD
jgi:branched-chain amino acid aminotransferase